MANMYNVALPEVIQPVVLSAAAAGTTTTYVSLKNYGRVSFLITGINDSTGSAATITLSQATSAAGAGAKTLAYSQYWSDSDEFTTPSDILTLNTASSTFNTSATASKTGLYVIDVKSSDLDVTNGFDFVAVTVGASAHQTVVVHALARAERYGQAEPMVSALV
jgi:hypothetical protein